MDKELEKILKELYINTNKGENSINKTDFDTSKLDKLKILGLIKGTRADDTGWIIIALTKDGIEKGESLSKSWYENIKIDWKWFIGSIFTIVGLYIAYLELIK